jgi:hypothetical protein
MEDNEYLYGVYQADVLYPGRWYKTGHYMPQEEGKTEYKTALDLILPKPSTVKLGPDGMPF